MLLGGGLKVEPQTQGWQEAMEQCMHWARDHIQGDMFSDAYPTVVYSSLFIYTNAQIHKSLQYGPMQPIGQPCSLKHDSLTLQKGAMEWRWPITSPQWRVGACEWSMQKKIASGCPWSPPVAPGRPWSPVGAWLGESQLPQETEGPSRFQQEGNPPVGCFNLKAVANATN